MFSLNSLAAASLCLSLLPWMTGTALAQGAAIAPAAPDNSDDDVLIEAIATPWTGDLDGILERGILRLGVAYGMPFLLYDHGDQVGLSVDVGREFEKHLRAKLGKPARTLTVILTPLPRDAMLDAITQGRVDIVAANLTITEPRLAIVDFTDPVLTGVNEIVVTGPAAAEVATLDDLVAVGLHLRPSSSYFTHVEALNATRAAAGQPPIPVTAIDENLEDIDVAELVDLGVIPATVIDAHKIELFVQLMENLTPHPDITVAEGGSIAWALRKESPQLMAATNAFIKTTKKGTQLGNVLYRRWLADAKRARNAMAPGEDEKFHQTIALIRAHAETYEFDPILIAAQGYQESGLDQSKRSKVGAIGIMQLMPTTAHDPNVAIPDIDVADRNVEAGVKYLRFLRKQYFSTPDISALDQTLLSFAAYNAGPGNISKARRRAEKMGLNPNVWFGNVEIATATAVSREPVVYVRNILKYYTTYQLAIERRAAQKP